MKAIISLGGGVQSTALCLLAAKGAILPMPVVAVFADTGYESQATLANVARLGAALPFPVITERRVAEIADANMVPLFVHGNGREGQLRRQCTSEWKIRPVTRHLRRIAGMGPIGRPKKGSVVECWIGFDAGEVFRMKDNRLSWVKNRYPLSELGWTREECQRWLVEIGWGRVERSACIFCPYSSAREFKRMAEVSPLEFERAVAWDTANRNVPGVESPCYVHRSLTPLKAAIETSDPQADMFAAVCEGACAT
jgi:hypothetical protein